MQVSYILTVGPSRLRPVLLYCSLLFTIPIQANPLQTIGSVTTERELGIQLYKKGDFKGALTHLQTAVTLKKDDADAWYYLGLALNRDSQVKQASRAYETAVKLRPNFASARAGLAFTFLLRNKLNEALGNKLNEALGEAKRALNLDSNSVDAHFIIGVVRLRNGDNRSSLEEANTAIRLDPSFAQGYLLKSQALVSFFQGTEIAPENEPPEERLARYKAAAESLDKYLKLSPGTKKEDVWRQQLEALQFSAGLMEKTGRESTIFSSREVSVKARVLSKPEPAYTEKARQNQVTGTVVLRAIFSAEGQVKYIIVVRGLPDGLTEAAIAAAKKHQHFEQISLRQRQQPSGCSQARGRRRIASDD